MIEFKTSSNIPKDFTGICKVADSGNIFHFKNEKRHNESGPAICLQDETKCWYINDICHREDGPSIEYVDGSKAWFYKSVNYGIDDDFTIETWKEKVKQLKREEELKIFK